MPLTTEDEKVWKFKSKTLITGLVIIISFAITSTFTLTIIFAEFNLSQKEQTDISKTHDDDYNYILDEMEADYNDLESQMNTNYIKLNTRLDTKTARNKDEIDKLKEYGSDNK